MEVGAYHSTIGGEDCYIVDEFEVTDNKCDLNFKNGHNCGKVVIQLGSDDINTSLVVKNASGNEIFNVNSEGTLTIF